MTKLQIALYRKNLAAILNSATRPSLEEVPELTDVFAAFDKVKLPEVNDLVLRIAQESPAMQAKMLQHKPTLFTDGMKSQLSELGVNTKCLTEAVK